LLALEEAQLVGASPRLLLQSHHFAANAVEIGAEFANALLGIGRGHDRLSLVRLRVGAET
jgi:hypothetical protein